MSTSYNETVSCYDLTTQAEWAALMMTRQVEMGFLRRGLKRLKKRSSKVWKKLKKPLLTIAPMFIGPVLGKSLSRVLGLKSQSVLGKLMTKTVSGAVASRVPSGQELAPEAVAGLSPEDAASIQQMLDVAKQELTPGTYGNIVTLVNQGRYDEAVSAFNLMIPAACKARAVGEEWRAKYSWPQDKPVPKGAMAKAAAIAEMMSVEDKAALVAESERMRIRTAQIVKEQGITSRKASKIARAERATAMTKSKESSPVLAVAGAAALALLAMKGLG